MLINYFFSKKLELLKEFYAIGKRPFDQVVEEAEAEYGQWSGRIAGEDIDPSPPIELEDKYERGKACKDLLGQACLSALAQTLKEYLNEYVKDRGRIREAEKLASDLKKQRMGWLQCYKIVFRDLLGCDWDKAPVAWSVLEEIALARNAIQHEGHIRSLVRYQDRQYKSKYPLSLFVDEVWPGLISVTEDNLSLAMDTIEKFVEWLERTR